MLGALAVVWVALVPTLEHRLVAGRQSELAASARGVIREQEQGPVSQDSIDEASRGADARVVYYVPLALGVLAPRFDSSHLRSSADVERDPVALRAAATPELQRGRVSSAAATPMPRRPWPTETATSCCSRPRCARR